MPLLDVPLITLDSTVQMICGGCSTVLPVNGSLTVYDDGRICTGQAQPHQCHVNDVLGMQTVTLIVQRR